MKKLIVIVLLSIGFALVGLSLWLWLPSRTIRRLDARYWQVQQGMTATEVGKIMDHPGVWRDTDFKAWWDSKQLGASEDARIRRAVRYTVSTFMLPVSFEFTFDEQGKVVGRHRYD